VGDHGEVGEVALYAGVQEHGGLGVAEGGPVLVQQVHQLFRDQPAQKHVLYQLNVANRMLFMTVLEKRIFKHLHMAVK